MGRLQCAMMIGNKVGVNTVRVLTHANVQANKIYYIKHETNSMSHFLRIIWEYLELNGCRCFQPVAELISHIIDAMSLKKIVDPVAVCKTVRSNPGLVIS